MLQIVCIEEVIKKKHQIKDLINFLIVDIGGQTDLLQLFWQILMNLEIKSFKYFNLVIF